MPLSAGKVSATLLQRVVYRNLGAKVKSVLLGPGIGEDAAVLDTGNEFLIASSDPVTGAVARLGASAVHVNANDVATRGAVPRWFLSNILLPLGSRPAALEKLSREIHRACEELGVAIVGGHAECIRDQNRPMVVGCMLGLTQQRKFISTSGAKVGDRIIMTKTAGIEGTSILASDRAAFLREKMGREFVYKARDHFNQISVVKDALIAFQGSGIRAMHDPTEGGIAGGLHELADASNTGFVVAEERIRISLETREICRLFSIDPMSFISSGSLLISCHPNQVVQTTARLRRNDIHCAVIGAVVKPTRKRSILARDGTTRMLVRPSSDQLWRALKTRL
ncbi:MAG: AIR synthase family protein [Candidatus Bathyarchaeia archaeon]